MHRVGRQQGPTARHLSRFLSLRVDLNMDSQLGVGHDSRVVFRVGRDLRYKDHARAIAGAIDGVNIALRDSALASYLELSSRIESDLAKFGRVR